MKVPWDRSPPQRDSVLGQEASGVLPELEQSAAEALVALVACFAVAVARSPAAAAAPLAAVGTAVGMAVGSEAQPAAEAGIAAAGEGRPRAAARVCHQVDQDILPGEGLPESTALSLLRSGTGVLIAAATACIDMPVEAVSNTWALPPAPQLAHPFGPR